MIINHNISAMNTQMFLNKSTIATQKSLQRLSSGLRINSAADDAAGLAISEKMKAQISGLEQAARNAQDGVSMLQAAEGGLDQTHSILQRMRRLAVQSASDTNTADDRGKIQSEVDQLAKEITRISNTTEFNTQNLLAGGMSGTLQIGANAGQNFNISISAMDAQSLGVAGSVITVSSVAANSTGLNLSSISRGITASASRYTIQAAVTSATINTDVSTTVNKDGGTNNGLAIGAVSGNFTGTCDTSYMIKVASTNTFTSGSNEVTSVSYSKDNGTSWTTVIGDFHAGVKLDGVTLTFATSKGTVTGATAAYSVGDSYTYSLKASKETLQMYDSAGTKLGAAVDARYGDTSATVGDGFNNKTVTLQFGYHSITSGTIGLKANQVDSSAAIVTQGKVLTQGNVVAGISVITQADANRAITAIDKAIDKVSDQRSQLGSYENRLQYTIDNLNTTDENITAALSRIVDVDMSKEICSYQKNNVLQQVAAAMLAHANQLPQTVLQLLQG